MFYGQCFSNLFQHMQLGRPKTRKDLNVSGACQPLVSLIMLMYERKQAYFKNVRNLRSKRRKKEAYVYVFLIVRMTK